MNTQTIKSIICQAISHLYEGGWDYCSIQNFKYDDHLKCWVVTYTLTYIGNTRYTVRREKRFSLKRLEEFVKYYER